MVLKTVDDIQDKSNNGDDVRVFVVFTKIITISEYDVHYDFRLYNDGIMERSSVP